MAQAPTERTRVRRAPDRGHYEREVIDAILDEGLVCHVGFVDDGQPTVIPTLHVRLDDDVYIHGATASRMVKVLEEGAPACLTVTILDGLVLARSAFHHAVNYRSVVVLGTARRADDRCEKLAVLEALTDRIGSGRWSDIRPPTDGELARTTLLAFPITEASAKIRTGPPNDDEADYALDVWAGVVPLTITAGEPVPDPRVDPSTSEPGYIRAQSRMRLNP